MAYFWLRVPMLAAVAASALGCVLDATIDAADGVGGASASVTGSTSTAGGAAGVGGSAGSGAAGSGGAATGVCDGDGMVDPGEQCDNLGDDGDGCDATCTYAPYTVCPPLAGAVVVPVNANFPVVLVGDTTAGIDNLPYTDGKVPKFDCKSDGDDVAYVIEPAATGTLTLQLRVSGDEFGSNNEKARLHVRRSCTDLANASEQVVQQSLVDELACVETFPGPDEGIATTQLWVYANTRYYVVVDGEAGEVGTFDLRLELTRCGDGVVQGLEDCDGGATCLGCLSTATPNDCGPAVAASRLFVNGHCYVVVDSDDLTFHQARRACVAQGGDLVAAETDTEVTALTPLAVAIEAWVGAEDFDHSGDPAVAHGYRWLTNDALLPPASMIPWLVGKPDTNNNEPRCVYTTPSGADDETCQTSRSGYVCELRFANAP